MKVLQVEGWRGVNHSFALVNQHQLLELMRRPGWQVCHRDLPFAMGHWSRERNSPGFMPGEMEAIDALPAPAPEQRADAWLRLGSPFAAVTEAAGPQLTFMVTELGITARSFADPALPLSAYTSGQRAVITPTRWSRDRLADFGLDPGGIHVVPHGVRLSTFHPLSAQERAHNRQSLGIQPDEFVLLNLGVATWNKGLDLLLVAFARLRQRHPQVRLILKDQRDLYGISVEPMLKDLAAQHPSLFTADTLAALRFIPTNLQPAELRLLYGLADCYVSPYRGEGFNLPVLEAIACGTPVVVTDGGATDDFFVDGVGSRVQAREGQQPDAEGRPGGRFREVDPDALLQALETHVQGWRAQHPDFAVHAMDLAQRMSWARAVDQLLALIDRLA
ncbi:glycosyltransferase [Aquabacterium lacunae]|uniref:Glycosyltransferase n=1 Tax=Aquabacterium lacunae TaxID=2528630 RepID=A0A4Q9H0F0_9BURK|nr:glycosyltransferase family 4 protein [Aquabacterium lacunae]TBO32588.1 glycosyltransferase [Aquabacterium lacunae]